MQLWELLSHQAHENVEDQVDLVHIETIEIEKHVFPVHDVGKENECVQFLAVVQENAPSDIAHALHISQVRPEQTVCQKDIPQGLIQPVAISKDLHLGISSVQVLLDDFKVLPELSVLVGIFFT